MNIKKGPLQKLSFASGIICFLLAIVTAVSLYFQLQVADKSDPVSASLAATVFFFVCVGFVLSIMGNANIPSFRFDKQNTDESIN